MLTISWAVARCGRPIVAVACAILLSASAVMALQQPEVHAINNAYEPATLTVASGTSVRFVNDDSDIHTFTDKSGGFDSGLLFKGDAWTYVFNTPGSYEYFCLPHPFMVGTVVVE